MSAVLRLNQLHASLAVLLTLGLIYGIGLSAVIASELGQFIQLMLACLVLGSLCADLYQLYRLPSHFAALSFNHGTIQLHSHGGEAYVATLLSHTVVSPWLTIVSIQDQTSHACYRLILLPDSLPKEDYRKLRVYLTWYPLVRSQNSVVSL